MKQDRTAPIKALEFCQSLFLFQPAAKDRTFLVHSGPFRFGTRRFSAEHLAGDVRGGFWDQDPCLDGGDDGGRRRARAADPTEGDEGEM